MKIAFLELQSRGGLLQYHVQLAEALAERGNGVDIVLPEGHELSGYAGDAVLRAELPGVAPSNTGDGSIVRRARAAWRLGTTWLRVVRILRRSAYDAVLTGCDVGLSLNAAGCLAVRFACRDSTFGLIHHNIRPFSRWRGDRIYATSPLLHALLAKLLRRLDVVFVHGEKSRSLYGELWPAPRRLALIEHGDSSIVVSDPPRPSDEERVLFFGFWTRVKGIPVLMEAFDQLIVERPEAKLTIAGSPSNVELDARAVRQWAARHGDRVQLIDDYVPLDEVPALFAAARVVVTPYLAGGFQSGVIHLAATSARAVVTSDVGELGETVVDGVTGRVVPPGDPLALARALEEVLRDGEHAARLGEAARTELLRRGDWSTIAASVEEHLVAARVAVAA